MAAAGRQDARKSMMLEQPISRIIPKMAIPTIVAFLINSIYSLADTFFVSSLGTNATAAVSVNSSLDQIIMMAGSMLAIGALSIRLQCIALPIHAWVAVVNMFCSGLGKAKGALLLATARQGSCFLPIVYPLARLFDANGVASVQAVADGRTFFLPFPLICRVLKEVKGKAAECGQL